MKHFSVLQQIPGEDLRYLQPIRRFPESRSWAMRTTTGNTTQPTLDDYLLLKVDAAELGQFNLLAFNRSLNKFNSISVSDFSRQILAMQVLDTTESGQLVFLQTRGAGERICLNHLLVLDGLKNQFKIVYEFVTVQEIRLELISTEKGDVLAQYCTLLDTVDLYEVKWISAGALALQRRGEIKKAAVKQIVAVGRNLLALLIEKKQVELWRFNAANDHFEQQFVLPSLVDPVSVVVCEFKQQHLIAVQCAGQVVEIFVLVQGRQLLRYQTLQVGDQPLEMRFVVMSSGELMLAVGTANLGRSLVLFRYAGLSLFVERLGYSQLGVRGRRISDLVISGRGDESARNFMFVVGEREAVILEAIMEK